MGTTPPSPMNQSGTPLVPPGRTPMFENSPSAPGRIFDWALNRTWWIFFEKLAKGLGGGAAIPVVGWDLQDTTPGTDVSDPVIPVMKMTVTICQIRIKVTDTAHPLEINIRNNGKSIFTTHPLIAAGTTTRSVRQFKAFAGSPVIQPADDVVIDVVQGGAWQVAVYLT